MNQDIEELEQPEKYHIALRIIHWLMAICILGLIGIGWYMAGLDQNADNKYFFYSWHKSFGVLVLFLFIIRVALRLKTKTPPLQSTIDAKERKAAHIVHAILYLGMFIVPVSGYIMSDIGGHSVKFFGIKLPDFLATDKYIGSFVHTFHEYAPYILLAFVALHIAGALKHRFLDKEENNVLNRMI